MTSAGLFIAAQLARTLAVTPQAIRQRLGKVVPDGELLAGGNRADAWRVNSLPPGLLSDLAEAWKRAEDRAQARPWRDLEHFMSDPPAPLGHPDTTNPPISARAKGWKVGELDGLEALAGLLSADLTPGEVADFIHCCFETLQSAAADGRPGRERGLWRWIGQRVSALAMTRRTFNRKLKAWRLGGRTAQALSDRRSFANTARTLVRTYPEADMDRLVSCAIRCHWGKVSPAWAELMSRQPDQGGFSETVRERFAGAIPDTIRAHASAKVLALKDFVLQPREAGNSAAYSDRDWSEVAAADFYTGDDITPEVYFAVPDGAGGYQMTRGQFIFLHDERSRRILDFIIIPERGFSAGNVRSLMRAVCLKYGLPRKGFVLENGKVFRHAALVSGAVSWGEVKTSFAQRLGIEIHHTRPGNHKGKLAEGVGGILQGRLRKYPGWCGPNEMVYPIEATRKALADVEAKRLTPEAAGFYSLNQWCSILSSECAAYNATPQDSKVMGGAGVAVHLSPNDAWRNLAGGEPVVGLRESGAEYLLTHHMRMVNVRRTGIRFQLGKELYAYSGAATAHSEVVGQEVKFYFDPELPDVAFLETVNGRILTVERQKLMPAHAASESDWKHRDATVEAHNRGLKALVSNLPWDFLPAVRSNVLADETAKRGAEMARGRAEAGTRKRKLVSGQGTARRLGIAAPASARMADALDIVNQVIADRDAEN